MVSAAGFEPTAPGFIPLRLSPPPPDRRRRSWSGLSLHPRPEPLGAARPVSTPSRHPRRGGLGSGSARRLSAPAFPDFERIHRAVSPRGAQLVTRNPVLYPAELRGQPWVFYSHASLLGKPAHARGQPSPGPLLIKPLVAKSDSPSLGLGAKPRPCSNPCAAPPRGRPATPHAGAQAPGRGLRCACRPSRVGWSRPRPRTDRPRSTATAHGRTARSA